MTRASEARELFAKNCESAIISIRTLHEFSIPLPLTDAPVSGVCCAGKCCGRSGSRVGRVFVIQNGERRKAVWRGRAGDPRTNGELSARARGREVLRRSQTPR